MMLICESVSLFCSGRYTAFLEMQGLGERFQILRFFCPAHGSGKVLIHGKLLCLCHRGSQTVGEKGIPPVERQEKIQQELQMEIPVFVVEQFV